MYGYYWWTLHGPAPAASAHFSSSSCSSRMSRATQNSIFNLHWIVLPHNLVPTRFNSHHHHHRHRHRQPIILLPPLFGRESKLLGTGRPCLFWINSSERKAPPSIWYWIVMFALTESGKLIMFSNPFKILLHVLLWSSEVLRWRPCHVEAPALADEANAFQLLSSISIWARRAKTSLPLDGVTGTHAGSCFDPWLAFALFKFLDSLSNIIEGIDINMGEAIRTWIYMVGP